MAILIDGEHKHEVDFTIEFVTYHNKSGEVRELKRFEKFSRNPNPPLIEDIGIREYDNLAVRFTSNERSEQDSKLYMDCFDFIDELDDDITLGQEDTGFIKINNEIVIHRHYDNDVGSPLIPGVYKIKVISNGENYYSQILIRPNNLEIEEHYQMIKEIENNVKGLARDWVRKNKSLDILKDYIDIDPTYLDYALLLLKNKNLLKYSMNIINKNPFSNLVKGYNETPLYRSGNLDNKSMKLNQLKPSAAMYRFVNSNEKIYSYNMEVHFNNKVNQYLLKILYDFMYILKKSLEDIYKVKKYFKTELNELNRYNRNKNIGQESKIFNRKQQLSNIINIENNIKNFYKELQYFKNNSVLKSIKLSHKTKISQQFIKNPGYNNFYRVSLLINGQLQNQIEDLYDYNWKSTEVLYEYWCMIKLIEYLKELEFHPVKGWFFESYDDNEKVTIPAIPDGTYIQLEKGELKINLIFNLAIGKSPEKAERDGSPYWIRTERNKPDFRLDVYKGDVFQKAIIMDAKYSSAERFWDKKHINTSKKSKVVEQLKLYANNIYNINNKRENVVEVVIALCPTYIKFNAPFDNDDNHSIGVATLKPGFDNKEFRERLEQFILQ